MKKSNPLYSNNLGILKDIILSHPTQRVVIHPTAAEPFFSLKYLRAAI